MASPPNPAVVPIVTYEYLFYLPSSEWPRPPALWKAWGLLPGSCIPVITGHRTQPNKCGYDPAPSNAKQLGSQVPCTGYGPTTLD
jgi:hypothetical protein